MDGYKRPFRGSKIYVHKKDEEDNTLVNLYKESEFAKEESEADKADDDDPVLTPPKSPNIKAAPVEEEDDEEDDDTDSSNDDIDDFINDSESVDEEDVPVKKSVKKERKKVRKKEARKKSIKSTIAKIFVGIILIAALVCLCLWFFRPSLIENALDSLKSEDAVADDVYYSPLTGLESTNKKIATAETTCIMIENSVDARPQSGLNAAGVVYEAVAEAGITRFMAVYKDQLPSWVGPMRSARLTFVHLARPYNCGYAHVGGAQNAINTLNGGGYRNLDGGWVEGQYVFRVNDRWAPHNVYTDAAHLKEWSTAKGWTESKFNGFKRVKPDTLVEPEKRNATTITVTMSGDDSYNVRWKYNVDTNKYARSHVYGGAHMEVDKNKKQSQITTDVVIAMKAATVTRTTDPKWYDHTTTGSGEAYIFQNGTVQNATWRRATVKDELGFYDSEGNEIELNRGRTWISIYNNTAGGRVSWK